MTKNILVNNDHRECRVAIVEDGKLVQLFVERHKQIVGGIYKCKVESIVNGIDAAFVNIGEERNAFLYAGDIIKHEEYVNVKKPSKSNISKLLKEGEELLVQVVKAPRGSKGARVTTKITIPGRFLVIIPNSDTIGISQRLEDEERRRLKKIIEEIKPKNYGIIVRTEAENISKKDLKKDIELMVKIYEDIEKQASEKHAPALVYKELSLVYQTIRDYLNDSVSNMFLDNLDDFKKAQTISDFFDIKLKGKIKHYKDSNPIFEQFGIEHQYKQLFKRKVWLPNGANICIDHAEALTVIDVNSGKFTEKKSLGETVFATNLEAAKEIARQIRLRDIGGIIIVDFIDMENASHKHQLIKKLGEELKKEKTKTTITQVSPLGLVEMSRKRTIENISETTSQMCPYCSGRGTIENPETVSLRIEREIRRYLIDNKVEYGIIVNVHPSVAVYLAGDGGENIDELQLIYNTNIFLRAYDDMHIEDAKILKVTKEMYSALNPVSIGQVYTIRPIKSILSFKDKAYTFLNNIYTEIPYGAKYAGKQVKILVKETTRNVIKAKIKVE